MPRGSPRGYSSPDPEVDTLDPPSQVVQGTSDRDLWEVLKDAKGQPVSFFDDSEDRVRSLTLQGRSARPRTGRRLPLDMRPTPIPPDQMLRAFDEAGEFLAQVEQDHPILSNAIINNPQMLHILPEISMLLGGPSGLGIDVAGSLLEAMPNAVDYRSYAETMFETPVQQQFWTEVASDFDSEAKDVITYLFAGLEERGADRVASKAFAWLRNRTRGRASGGFFDETLNSPGARAARAVAGFLSDETTAGEASARIDTTGMTVSEQDELLLRLWNWSEEEQQTELHDTGFFGYLHAGQQFLQENLVEVPITGLVGWLGDPEEAIRRSGLTMGQQAMYQFGLDPDDTMWSIGSGALDAIGEVILDPLNAIAGAGVGIKASKTIPFSIKAVSKGRRTLAALKSAVPIWGRKFSPLQTRSLTARLVYPFRAKTIDDLLDTFAGTRAGKEAFELLSQGNRARFLERFPQLDRLPDNFYEAAKFLKDPDDMAELMKHIHWTDNLADPSALDDAVQELDRAKTALDSAATKTDDLELGVLRAQMKVDQIEANPSNIFVIADLPTKPNRTLYNFVSTKVARRENHVENVARRWAHDVSQSVPSEINMFNTKKSLAQVRQLLQHYGVEANKMDDLLNKYIALDVGERMEFMLKKVVPAIGDATQNPLLRYNMVELYRRTGVRSFNPGLDEAVDAAGNVSHLPIAPSQMQQAFKFPVQEVDQIIRRHNQTGKLKGALTLGRRGLVGSTRTRRTQLVQRLRGLVGDKLPEGLSDEELYQMAYSWVGRDVDPRGWLSKFASGMRTKVLKPFDVAFRKAMLGLRPIQWLFKVVILEEPIRSHVYEMPNMYTRPLGWTQEVFSNHYLNKADDWAKKNIEWVDNVRAELLAPARTADEAVDIIRAEFGKAADDILGDRTYRSLEVVSRRLGSWMHKASVDSQQVGKLPGSHLMRRWRAWRVNKASDIKKAELLKPSFTPKDDLEDIAHKTIYTLFGDELATSQAGVVPFKWKPEMSSVARTRYGHAWGSKIEELATDPAYKWGLKRMLAKASGGEIGADLTAEAFMESSTWKVMKGNIRRFYPEETTDAARVERYFDEKIEGWIEEILQPVFSQQGINRAEFLESLIERRAFKVGLNGHNYDIDLRSAGSARRKLAELVEDQSTFARTTPFPEEIAAVPFDWRFLDGSTDKNAFRRIIDWNIETFGEKATQNLNRRPFWRAQRRKWLNIYKDNMGLPDGLAAQLATEKATKLTNYVMYDISEAPSVVKKLNNTIPFFGATYEVMTTWTYKMPAAVGGYWALGAGAFARKIDRLMRAFISTGLVKVEERDGKKNYELQLWREPDTGTPLGDALSSIGYLIRRTPENAIAQLLGLWPGIDPEEAQKLTEDGYGFSLGNPLDPTDYGVLSFAQFHAGLNPAQNWIVNETMGRLFPAADVQRTEVTEDTTLADLADKLEVDVDDLARANRNLFGDQDDYRGIFSDDVDPADIPISAGSLVVMPGSSLYETIVEDIFMPFGEIDSPAGIIRSLVPSMFHHVLRGFGLHGTPSDGAWLDDSGELDSTPFFGNVIDKAAVNSQLLEAFYYLESAEGIFTNEIFPLQQRYEELVAAGGGAKADEVKAELERLTNEAIKRATDMAGGALILRGLSGGFFPNTGRALRQEMDAIDSYWDSRDFAEQLQGTDADGNKLVTAPLKRISKPGDIDEFFTLTAKWLGDETGDDARAFIRQNHPTIFAYLQPKTYWGEAGPPPEITSYEDYLDQIRSGKREPVPLAVAIQRHLHAGVEADYWTDFVATFGNDPEVAVSRALDNYEMYLEMQDERYSAKDALYMSDDLHGGEYQEWLDERGSHPDDTYESVEIALDRQREAFDTLQTLLDIEIDPNMDPAEIREFRSTIKQGLAKFSDIIDSLEGDGEDSLQWKNPYELAMNSYWTKIYDEFEKATDDIWDAIGQSTDTEETSLLFEKLKLRMNEWSQKRFTLFDRTDVTYPSPLDIRWARKTEDERRAFAMKRATLPLEWLNLDDVARIAEYAPGASTYLPTSVDDIGVYTAWTERKAEIDEMAERGEITESDRRDLQSQAEEAVIGFLRSNGREDEAVFMEMWPIERLYVLELLPPDLEYLMPEVRFVRETLRAEDRGPRSQIGDKLLLPMYNALMGRAATDQGFGDMLRDLGLTLFDESAYDAILPRLIVGDFSDA